MRICPFHHRRPSQFRTPGSERQSAKRLNRLKADFETRGTAPINSVSFRQPESGARLRRQGCQAMHTNKTNGATFHIQTVKQPALVSTSRLVTLRRIGSNETIEAAPCEKCGSSRRRALEPRAATRHSRYVRGDHCRRMRHDGSCLKVERTSSAYV
jgi:hypothetical protein